MAAPQEYRLQALLKLREQAKADAEAYLGECIRALTAEQEKLQEMEDELERMIARREGREREYAEKAMRGEISAQGAVSNRLYIDRLKDDEDVQANAIEGQRQVIVQKEEDVADARRKLAEAHQELKALEKHKENWELEVKKEKDRKEEIAMDEIARSVHLRREE